MTSTPYWQKCWGSWGCCLNKAQQPNYGTGHTFPIQPVETWMELLQQLHQGFLSLLDLSLILLKIDVFHIGSLFVAEQLVSWHCHLVHLKGAVILIESKCPLYFDDSSVTPQHSLMTFANPPHLDHLPKAPNSKSARGPHLSYETSYGQTWLLPPPCLNRLGNPQSLTPDWSQQHWSVTHWQSFTPRFPGWLQLHWCPQSWVSVMVSSAPWGLYNHPFIGVSSTLGWTRGEVSELGQSCS